MRVIGSAVDQRRPRDHPAYPNQHGQVNDQFATIAGHPLVRFVPHWLLTLRFAVLSKGRD